MIAVYLILCVPAGVGWYAAERSHASARRWPIAADWCPPRGIVRVYHGSPDGSHYTRNRTER